MAESAKALKPYVYFAHKLESQELSGLLYKSNHLSFQSLSLLPLTHSKDFFTQPHSNDTQSTLKLYEYDTTFDLTEACKIDHGKQISRKLVIE